MTERMWKVVWPDMSSSSMSACTHHESLYGRCSACGMTWEMQAKSGVTSTPVAPAEPTAGGDVADQPDVDESAPTGTFERRRVMKYRKKPVEVEARQLNSLNYDEAMSLVEWCGGRAVDHDGHMIAIDTLEGTMYADDGDWIIKGVQGEFYPCKPDIFEATYEPVDHNGDE